MAVVIGMNSPRFEIWRPISSETSLAVPVCEPYSISTFLSTFMIFPSIQMLRAKGQLPSKKFKKFFSPKTVLVVCKSTLLPETDL